MRKHADKDFGLELLLNLYNCDLDVLKSKEKLTEYVENLCELIEMKKYGKTLLEYFGTAKEHTKGFSLLQFIETSAIVGHFSEYWRTAYINIFSCKTFDPKVARKFSKKFFGAKTISSRFIVR